MVFLLSLVGSHDFVTCRTLPILLTLGRSARFSFMLSFLVYGYFFMFHETVLGSAIHITVLALDGILSSWAMVSFTHDAFFFTLVFFSIAVVDETFLTEVVGAEKAGDGCDGMEVVVVDVVDVNAGSFISTWTGHKFVA